MAQEPPVNRTYRRALAVALTMCFVTLTGAIILAIISSARESEREAQFNATVTAIVSAAEQTLVARETPPTTAPQIQPGVYPFEPDPSSPRYGRSELPTSQVVYGQVLDADGQPEDRFTVIVWGDYTPPQTVSVGEIAEQEAGHWALALEGRVNRRLWVQLSAGERYLSAPVEIVLSESNPARSAAEVIFRQVGTLN